VWAIWIRNKHKLGILKSGHSYNVQSMVELIQKAGHDKNPDKHLVLTSYKMNQNATKENDYYNYS